MSSSLWVTPSQIYDCMIDCHGKKEKKKTYVSRKEKNLHGMSVLNMFKPPKNQLGRLEKVKFGLSSL